VFKWIGRIFLVGIVSYIALVLYEYKRLGLFSMPDLPQGAYFVSFKNGLRGVVLNADVPETSTGYGPKLLRSLTIENRERKYLGIPSEVPSWFADAWSTCQAPTEQEQVGITVSLPDDLRRRLGNARFEAVCWINVDGEPLMRGLIFSVPRL
jgi:hypothetical protein